MLVLSRKIGEVITIGSNIAVTILSFDRGIVRVGIEAPKDIAVHRKEVYDKIIDMNKQAAQTSMAAIKDVIATIEFPANGSSQPATNGLSHTSARPLMRSRKNTVSNGTYTNGTIGSASAE